MANEQDVKETVETSTTPVKGSTDTATADESKEAFVEEAKRTIPYSRFKEKVDETKELNKQLKNLNSEKDQAVAKAYAEAQTYYESEISKLQRQYTAQTQDIDLSAYSGDETSKVTKVYDEKINNLHGTISELKKNLEHLSGDYETQKLNTRLESLKQVYPSIDETFVLGIKKAKPDWSLEECAEYVHNKIEGLGKNKYDKIMDDKKKAAKVRVIGEDGKINLKPEERPKNFQDAKKKLAQFLSNQT
jgi:hypothetical protein